jgi:large subunit ribosomal protein L17
MKKQVFGRKFKRDANERKALFKNLLTSLVLKERIKTTEAKAKAIKGAADKLVTKAKKEGVNVYKSLHPDVNQDAVVKLIEDIAPRFAKRKGGYTRILKIGKRRVADNAEMVYLEWTEQSSKIKSQNSKLPKKIKKTTKPAKKIQVESEKTQVVKAQEIKKQPKVREVVRKLVTRQKKGQ